MCFLSLKIIGCVTLARIDCFVKLNPLIEVGKPVISLAVQTQCGGHVAMGEALRQSTQRGESTCGPRNEPGKLSRGLFYRKHRISLF